MPVDRATQIAIDAKAPSAYALYIMPFATTPPPRPAYPGPVVMQIPQAQLVNVRTDGTIAGGGGLVNNLDFVWTS
jgi:hypothetical protein